MSRAQMLLNVAEGSSEVLTQEMIDTMDWKALESQIAKVVGTGVSIKPRFLSGIVPSAHSVAIKGKQNLVKKCGLFATLLKNVWVVGSNGTYFPRDNYYQMWIDLVWEFKGGIRSHEDSEGGQMLFKATWDFGKKKWTFK